MPTPSRTSLDAIVNAGLLILESNGPAGLTMHAVAKSVGVKSPSLYKHVADRDALLTLVADAAARDLVAHLPPARQDHTAEDLHSNLAQLARSLRGWAHRRPEAFRLAFAGRGSEETLAAAAEPILATTQGLAGEEHALNAARLVTAWAMGFISMELAGAFRLGGNVEEAFEFGLERLSVALDVQSHDAVEASSTREAGMMQR